MAHLLLSRLFALSAVLLSSAAYAQETAPCPPALGPATQCYKGQDANGAYYWIAVPERWNGVLVVHAHGGPRLTVPAPGDPLEDLQRFAVTLREGFAWAGSSYRRQGYGARMAAEDTDNLRKIAWDKLGRPRRTIIHGQSWGANVAAKLSELYAVTGAGDRLYDGVVLTSGVLAGGTLAYDFRADLRAVYQHYCANHPRPDEQQYPLWQGLPEHSVLTRKDLEQRVKECTGVGMPTDQRSEDQKRKLANILAVIRIPERTLVSHLDWATFTFQDLLKTTTGGLNPFTNEGVTYTGSSGDEALNRDVQRFASEPAGERRLAYDSDLTGLIVVPTLTMHAKNDPTAFVEHEAAYREVVDSAGSGSLLVQTFTNEGEHSKLSTPEYAALFSQMLAWIERGEKPSGKSVAESCAVFSAKYQEACLFDISYFPPRLSTRTYPRRRH